MVGGPDDVLGDHEIEKICLGWDEDFRNNHVDHVGDKENNCERKYTEDVLYFHPFQVCRNWSIFHDYIDDADDDMDYSDHGRSNDEG